MVVECNDKAGLVYERFEPCACMKVRAGIAQFAKSGMKHTLSRYTLSGFHVSETWQQEMFNLAMRYVNEGAQSGAWLYMGGGVGTGKTHICTAVAKMLMEHDDRSVRYMTWPEDADTINAMEYEQEAQKPLLRELENAEVLFIDDFLKSSTEGSAARMARDMRLAYKIINRRYIERKTTIICSELYISEIRQLDEGIASRIAQMAAGYTMAIRRENGKNQRYRRQGE